MKYGLSLLLFLLLLSSSLTAQEEDDDDDYRPSRRDRSGGIIGGGGGIIPTWSFLNLSKLNGALQEKGLPQCSEDGMFMFGGQGYAYLVFIPNLRIGGLGYGGALETRRDMDGRYQSSRLDVSAGGVTLEYVIPFGRLHFALGGLIGGGSYTLTLTESDNVSKSWGSLFPSSPASASDSRHELVNSFFAFQPTFTIEYELHPFIVAGVSAGYFGTAGDEWKLDDNFTMTNMPAFDMSGIFVRAGLTFGLFLGE
jgi:hypothetical protein